MPEWVSRTHSGQWPKATSTTAKTYDYVGGAVFEGGKLEFVPTAEGRVLPPGRAVNPAATIAESYSNVYPRHEYHLKDHLGDLRVACRCMEVANPISPANAVGPVVVQEEHYDPWGLSLAGLSSLTVATPSRFKFINREEQQGLGLIDLMARQYDPATVRFITIDPLPDTEGQESMTGYQYGWNNPILKSDPTGRLPDDPWYKKVMSSVKSHMNKPASAANQEMWASRTSLPASSIKTQGDVYVAMVMEAMQSANGPTRRGSMRPALPSSRQPLALPVPRVSARRQAAQAKLDIAAQGSKGTNGFIGTPDGTVMHNSASELRNSLNNAGFNGVPSRNNDGTIHILPTQTGGSYSARIMDGIFNGGQYQGPRVVTTSTPYDKQYVNPNGTRIVGAIPLDDRKAIGHTHLNNQ